jgi:hypothetical protein
MSKVEPTDFVSAGSAGASSLPPPPPQLEDLNSSRPVLITGFIGSLLNMIAGTDRDVFMYLQRETCG